MNPEEKKVMDDTISHFIANVMLLRIKQECMEVFFLNALETLGLQETSGKSLMDALQENQSQALNQALATVSDDRPAVASALRQILAEELERHS